MDNPAWPFNELLEKYALTMANLFIDQASPGTQTDLINLIFELETGSLSDGVGVTLPSVEIRKTEWQQVLSKPVDPKFLHNQRLLRVIRQRMHTNEVCISQLETAVKATEEKNERIGESFLSRKALSGLQQINDRILIQYRRQIEVLKANQTKELDFLNRVLAQ